MATGVSYFLIRIDNVTHLKRLSFLNILGDVEKIKIISIM